MPSGGAGVRELRVAIVGLGPKGLFALERLLHHARREGAPALRVDVFERHPQPGGGPIYDPRQPAYLRMNLAADRLDMWPAGSRAVPAPERRSFVAWRRARGDGDSADEAYPPRALVGRYLADGLASLLADVPHGTTVAVRALAVHAARRVAEDWELAASDARTYRYDEVLVAVGHRTSGELWPGPECEHAAPAIPAVFPVTSRLTRERVAPAATVAVRGFALTCIDAALALTEGRGGTFEHDDHPYRRRYSPTARDAGPILPFSRSGRPMLAKPDPQLAASIPALAAIADAGRARILALGEGFELERDLLAILASSAAAAELAANRRARDTWGRRAAADRALRWLRCAARGAAPAAGAQGPADELERSLAIGAGLYPPDLQWALGQTWRSHYPALVARLGGACPMGGGWAAFHRLAAQMERVSFGPPAVNAAKLLALIAAGSVDVTHVAGARLVSRDGRTALRSAAGERAIDVVVNAVLPAPGAAEGDAGLLDGLLAGGFARVAGARRGLEVEADGRCVGADGRRTPGLSAIGRPTEDWVVGNDTLDRTLHPQADCWASRIVRRAMAPTVSEAA